MRTGPFAIAEWASCRHEFVRLCHQVFSPGSRSRSAVVTRPSLASSRYFLFCVRADVAVSPTVLAIIVHRAQAGVLGRRGIAVESAAARTCREAGRRVATNRFVRDLDVGEPVNDGRRLEVAVDRLPLHGGVQLAVDTTLVLVLHCDGSPHRDAADRGWGSFWWQPDEGRNEPALSWSSPGHRANLVVLAGEVAGRWSEETIAFIRHLAKARARGEPIKIKKRAEQGWRMRWCSLLACGAARAFATSLLEQRVPGVVDGETPNVHSVLSDWRFAGFDLAA